MIMTGRGFVNIFSTSSQNWFMQVGKFLEPNFFYKQTFSLDAQNRWAKLSSRLVERSDFKSNTYYSISEYVL